MADGFPDPLTRGTVRFKQHGVAVALQTAHGVFSAAELDPGTRFLLRWLGPPAELEGRGVLDLGCGYGPLAVWLAAAGASPVEAVDRDAVALEWTARNAAANGVADRVATTASVGYDDVIGGPFDLVVSNIPAKVGSAALDHLLLDVGRHLAPGGLVSVVVVARLAGAVRATLDAAGADVSRTHENRGYLQVTYAVEPGSGDARPGLERGVYDRGRARFAAGGVEWEATTVRTLPEFDTLGHGTAAAVELLAAAAAPHGPAAVVGVGQGHVPIALALLGTTRLALVDRDLLALRVASANVAAASSAAVVTEAHVARPTIPASTGVVVAALDEKEPVAVTAALLAPVLGPLDPDAVVVLHGRAADVGRVTELLGRHGLRLAEVDRRRRRGHVAVRLRPRRRSTTPNSDTPPS